jgi:hypothetical protein
MNRLVLRSILATLVLATAAGKIWSTRQLEADIRPATIAVVALKGWPTHAEAEDPADILRAPIEFLPPGCNGTARIFLVDLNLQMMPMLDQMIEAGYTRRIVYMGRTWPSEDRLGLRLEWLKHKVLALFGVGRYVASSTALVVAEPPGCRAADLLDWGLAWDRQTLAAVSTSRPEVLRRY